MEVKDTIENTLYLKYVTTYFIGLNTYHRSLEYIDWARAEFTCSDLSCLDERLGDFEKFPLPWLGQAHSTSHLGNQANRARSPRLSS